MTNKILLGKLKADAGTSADGENVWLTKQEWSCGWYWSFGWVGNKNCHFHFKSLLDNSNHCASELFEQTNISDNEWWVVRDLFIQAYALQKAAEVYRHGGHNSTLVGVTDQIKDLDLAKRLNADLEKILNTLWDYTCKAIEKKEEVAV